MSTSITFNDSHIIARKKNWATRASFLETVRQGAIIYIPINVTVAGTISLSMSTASLVAGSVSAANCPVISVYDNRGPGDGVTPLELITNPTQLSSASPQTVTSSVNGSAGSGSLGTGNHLIMIVVDNIRNDVTDQWNTPVQAVAFAGATFNGTCTTVTPGANWLPPNKAIWLGDSVMIGYANESPTTNKAPQAFDLDGTNTAAQIRECYPWILCDALNLEPIIDGFGGQGISKAGLQNAPAAFAGGAGIVLTGTPSWSNLHAGLGSCLTNGLFTDSLSDGDFIFDCHYQNDGVLAGFSPATSAGRQAAFKAWWDAIHAAAPRATLVTLLYNKNAGAYADKRAAAITYNNTQPGPFYLVDVSAMAPLGAQGPAVTPNIDAIDNLHPNVWSHSHLAALIQTELYKQGIYPVPTTYSWTVPTANTTILSTELNALANTQYTVVSADIDNETNHHLYMDLELVLASLAVATGGYCQAFLIASEDATNYEDNGSSTVAPPQAPIATFPLFVSTSAKRCVVSNIVVPPLHFKLIVGNQTGVALGGTLNTLKARFHDEQGA